MKTLPSAPRSVKAKIILCIEPNGAAFYGVDSLMYSHKRSPVVSGSYFVWRNLHFFSYLTHSKGFQLSQYKAFYLFSKSFGGPDISTAVDIYTLSQMTKKHNDSRERKTKCLKFFRVNYTRNNTSKKPVEIPKENVDNSRL